MTEPLLSVDDLSVGYGHVRVLERVSLTVPPGGFVALIGANGAGKSTLLRAISGLLKPYGGTIRFGGRDITRASPSEIVRAELLHVAEGRRLFRRQSVQDNLDLGLYGLKLSRADHKERCDEVYELFPMLGERRALPAGVLSGGQQQMLAIGQALVRRPRLLMLDEPSLGLAPILFDQVLDTIVTLKRRGLTILLVEQMVERALEVVDHGYVMRNGRVIGSGTAAALRGGQLIESAYGAAQKPAGPR
jgi:branched-chain amino acid transport system ATP-binding protein